MEFVAVCALLIALFLGDEIIAYLRERDRLKYGDKSEKKE
jgi:hypothetical protein